MTRTLIGYARCSTDKQDLEAQKQALAALGVAEDRIYTDHGMTGTSRARPGLDQALAAVRESDTLVVSKLDRLARSVPDARAIADQFAAKGVRLALGAVVHHPPDPMGKMFFNVLATFAEFEADLIRARTREGMAIARARGKLRGKQPKLSERQQKDLRRMHGSGEYSISDLAELFSVSRPTVYRTLEPRQPTSRTLGSRPICFGRIA
ncbi:recombinase family protein [Rhodobacter sp. CZR27]|uniref:recombinase family protein n=1 Tax=Rhodobacter sp. CZR27 TaxID=2033869 RepID=UPI000BBECD3C|nr:recombinase family protein [Rhodobacter sp. CZR27]